jgi:hypothetical protein
MRHYILTLLAIYAAFISCNQEKETYFYGETVIVDTNVQPDTLYGKKIELDGVYTGNLWVYDTLIGFVSHLFPDYYMHVFNVNTGKFLYPLCKLGIGPGEFFNISIADQLVYNESQLGYSINNRAGKGECVIVNLAKPGDIIEQKMNLDVDAEFPFMFVFILNDSLFLANNQGERRYYEEKTFTPQTYYLYNSRTKEKIKTYEMYNGFSTDSYDYNICYISYDRIKPDDRSKLAMGMCHIDQLNILDLTTGKIKGYRNKTSPDFSYLKYGNADDGYRLYYSNILVDDRYIYGLYSDTEYRLRKWKSNTVNVFDWDGNFIRRLFLDKTALKIALDPVNKYLYLDTEDVDENEEEIYRYDVSYLYK